LEAGDTQFERGKPNKVVDGIGWVVGIPSKLLLWDKRASNHHVTQHTEFALANYLAVNQLDDVKVRVNQYDPFGEWNRLTENGDVAPGWRYTVGTLHTLGYTLFPGRIFGEDSYNPYTKTVHLYSDIPALALEQAAYAKDVRDRKYPGTYAAAQDLPIVGLWHESLSKDETLAYLATYGTPNEQREAQRILYPQMGVEVGGEITGGLPYLYPLPELAGATVGHIVGRVRGGHIAETATNEPTVYRGQRDSVFSSN